MLNIAHTPRSIMDEVVFDDVLLCPLMENLGFLVIVVRAVELSTFIGYTCALYGHLSCGFRNTLVIR